MSEVQTLGDAPRVEGYVVLNKAESSQWKRDTKGTVTLSL